MNTSNPWWGPLRVRKPLEDGVAEDLEVDDVERERVDDACGGQHEPVPHER